MMKKGFVILAFLFMIFVLSACTDGTPQSVSISVPQSALTLTVGESHTLSPTTTDTVGLVFSSNNPDVASVDEDGEILALFEGSALITIASKQNPNTRIIVSVTVRKLITLTVAYETLSINLGEAITLNFTSNDDVIFTSDNIDVVTVDALGVVTGHTLGTAVVTIRSAYDSTIFQTITITVHPEPTAIQIDGSEKVNLGTNPQYSIIITPDTASAAVTWESSDETIATIDASGNLTPHRMGVVTISATSVGDDRTATNLTIEIVHQFYVSEVATADDEITHEGITFLYGRDLFSTIEEAYLHAHPNATLFIGAGNYVTTLDIDKEGTRLVGVGEALIQGIFTLSANDITVNNLRFLNGSSITNSVPITHLTFTNNIVSNHATALTTFIQLNGIEGLTITDNTFENLSSDAVRIRNVIGGTILIGRNTFHNLPIALDLDAGNDYAPDTIIKIERNDIDSVDVGIIAKINSDDVSNSILAYARFNSVTNYALLAAETGSGDDFDFTLNHWDGIPNEVDFTNISLHDLRGYYEAKGDIITEASYNPEHPAKILIVNPLSEIMIGESYTFNFEILPRELVTDRVRWITSNPDLLHIALDGTVTPGRSGIATLTIRSTINLSINASVTVIVTTTPGIELTPDSVINGIIVGDQFTLLATPFPLSMIDEDVTITSSDSTIASVNAMGVVTAHAPGVVTFTAALDSDPSVTNTFTIEIFAELDEDNLLDLLTMVQVTYSTPHEWTAYGVGFNYHNKRYESVSRYYFGEIPINTSRIIPVFEAIRPGEPMAEHPDGITQYNPDNVYWVVIHDTANTNPGSGALAHANYLYNQTILQNRIWVSWHYTIDDVDIYQHIPETERAFHAGDGSVLPGQSSTYFGGGNRNGVGIEMGINQDSDMYRTWQRTAKLATDILVRYNLPRSHLAYHIDFSGKMCPQSLIRAGLQPLFEEFADIEYRVRSEYSEATITMESHNPEYLDNTGRIIQMPQRALTVSYTITVTVDGLTSSRTFYTYLPGTDR